MIYTRDFQRFKGGLFYTISYSSDGEIQAATIFQPELNADVDVLSFVKSDAYWKEQVAQAISARAGRDEREKYFEAFKDCENI